MATGAEDDEATRAGLSRLLALSDGVFAIALTLLVLNLQIHGGLSLAGFHRQLGTLGSGFAAAGLTFVVAGRFWVAHHRIFDVIGQQDTVLLWLNLLFLASVIALPFVTAVLSNYGQYATAVQLYAGAVGFAAAVEFLLLARAARRRLLRPGVPEAVLVRLARNAMAAFLVFAASIPIAAASATLGKLVWLLVLTPGAWIVPKRLGVLVVRPAPAR